MSVIQKIVVNMATTMPIGRLFAQCAHASLLAILTEGEWIDDTFQVVTDANSELRHWLRESFTKVVVKGWGDAKLQQIYEAAKMANVPCGLMEEAGFVTAVSVGPAEDSKVNAIVGNLPLL